MNLITISREFGSGGRELGKRLAELLNYDYYDREIIVAIAKHKGLDENYIEMALENQAWQNIPLTFRNTFTHLNNLQQTHTSLLIEQTNVIESIGKLGKDCVIVGRNADLLLAEYKPFSIFVCAQTEAKIKRCQERAGQNDQLSRREIAKNLQRIDKNRAKTREMIAGDKWGLGSSYLLTVNTTDWPIADLAPAVAEMALRWFRR